MTPTEIARLLAKIQTRSVEECALADLHVCSTEPTGIKGEQQTVCSVCNCQGRIPGRPPATAEGLPEMRLSQSAGRGVVDCVSAKWMSEFVVADEETCKAPWAGGKNGKYFRCYFCGHHFVPGDLFRWIYSNDSRGPGGNPLTCKPCFDAHGGYEGLRDLWQLRHDELEQKFWWAKPR